MRVMDPALREGYETSRRMQRRHDPTYYFATRRLPAELRPATHALYGYVRTADQIVDGPRRPATPDGPPRRAGRVGGRARQRATQSRQPIVRALADAGRAPPAPARRAAHLHALDADRLRAGADLQLGGARRLHGRLGRLGRADHGRAAGRAGAPPCRPRPARARVPARELHPRRARGHGAWTASTCRPRTASASASARTTSRRDRASPEVRALLAHEVERARAPVRGRPAGDRRPRPRRCAPACASPPASTAACSTASRRRASTCWAARTGVRVWHIPGAALRGAAMTAARDAARRATRHAAHASAPTC